MLRSCCSETYEGLDRDALIVRGLGVKLASHGSDRQCRHVRALHTHALREQILRTGSRLYARQAGKGMVTEVHACTNFRRLPGADADLAVLRQFS